MRQQTGRHFYEYKHTRTCISLLDFLLIAAMNWTNWGEWSKCTVTCGGIQSRSRRCLTGHETRQGCYGPAIESRDCNECRKGNNLLLIIPKQFIS